MQIAGCIEMIIKRRAVLRNGKYTIIIIIYVRRKSIIYIRCRYMYMASYIKACGRKQIKIMNKRLFYNVRESELTIVYYIYTIYIYYIQCI